MSNTPAPTLKDKIAAERAVHNSRLSDLHRRRTALTSELKSVEEEIQAQSGAIIAFDRVAALIDSTPAAPEPK